MTSAIPSRSDGGRGFGGRGFGGGRDYSSPVIAGDRIYFVKNSGETIVLATGDEFKKLIDERNATMVRRMQPRLREGGALIAVGAMHLPGERGLLRLLLDRGYQLERVY